MSVRKCVRVRVRVRVSVSVSVRVRVRVYKETYKLREINIRE